MLWVSLLCRATSTRALQSEMEKMTGNNAMSQATPVISGDLVILYDVGELLISVT